MTLGTDATSVNSWSTLTDSRTSARCQPVSDCHVHQMEGDTTQNTANSPIFVNDARKRKTKINAGEEIDGELSARKKIKISTVSAVNLHD